MNVIKTVVSDTDKRFVCYVGDGCFYIAKDVSCKEKCVTQISWKIYISQS